MSIYFQFQLQNQLLSLPFFLQTHMDMECLMYYTGWLIINSKQYDLIYCFRM